MTLGEIVTAGGISILVVLSLVEITPIEVNPWSWIAKHLGRALNSEIMERLDKSEAITARYRIVSFDDELRHSDQKHSEERFTQLLGDIDTYERYCKSHPEFENTKAVHAIKNIKRVYDKCCDENSFI